MRYYFLGICGTAMASLAVLLKKQGHQVWGSDQNIYPPMSDFLAENKIEVWQGYDAAHLQKPFDVVVIGNALSRGNVEVEEILNQKMSFASLPEIIRKEFIQNSRSIVVTGTHGKTTTTALMSWVLHSAGLSPAFLIGGISRNFNSSVHLGNGDYFIIEGDEYDTAFFDKRPKFLHYLPDYLVINNIEFDHSDIYGDLEQIQGEFRKLIRTVPSAGLILANGDDENVREVINPVYSRLQTFGQNDSNDLQAIDIEIDREGTHFTLVQEAQVRKRFHIPSFGEFQVYNALAAIGAAMDLGISMESIQNSLSGFLNVKRRLEFLGKLNGAPFYDDFAHHPTAIQETLRGVRWKHPAERIIAVFEPRTNTTVTNIFQNELAEVLSLADEVVISPIYRSERFPVERRLSLDLLKKEISKHDRNVHLLPDYKSIHRLLNKISRPGSVVVFMSNGNFGGEYMALKQKMKTD